MHPETTPALKDQNPFAFLHLERSGILGEEKPEIRYFLSLEFPETKEVIARNLKTNAPEGATLSKMAESKKIPLSLEEVATFKAHKVLSEQYDRLVYNLIDLRPKNKRDYLCLARRRSVLKEIGFIENMAKKIEPFIEMKLKELHE